MSRRNYTNPIDIEEVEALSEHYDVVKWQAGTWLVEDWLFIYPKDQKWGERYRGAYGYYDRGKLKEFVDEAMQNKFDLNRVYHGKNHLKSSGVNQ